MLHLTKLAVGVRDIDHLRELQESCHNLTTVDVGSMGELYREGRCRIKSRCRPSVVHPTH